MSERSAAFNRLCEAALLCFAKDGYEGASLSTIADALGIRKASLYSHVKSKDELFSLLFNDAIAAEEAFATYQFERSTDYDLPGEAYLQSLEGRYATAPHMQLLLKAAYLPPQAHKPMIVAEFNSFYDRLRALFISDFNARFGEAEEVAMTELYAEAWLGIVDSLCVELLYGSAERTTLRKDAMLMLLKKAVRPEG